MALQGVTVSALLVLAVLPRVHVQQIADCGAFPEVVLILDSSGSIVDKGNQNWNRMTQFGINIITLLESTPDIRFSYISFSDYAVEHTPLTRNAQQVKNAIAISTHLGGLTNQADALKAGQNVLLSARQPSSKYIVIVTDGSPTLNKGDESVVAAQLRQQGVLNIAVGVTNQINGSNLLDIVGRDNKDKVFLRQSFTQLDADFSNLIVLALSACPPPPGECNDPDIVICVDASGSITEANTFNWGYMRMFIARLATQLFQDLPNVRIGLVTFSETAYTILQLTDSLTSVLREANNAHQLEYTTNQADAFRHSEVIFYNARIPSAKYIIVVTDGKPNVEKGQELVVADRLKTQGVRFIMIGVTDQIDQSNLQQVAGASGTVLLSPTFRDLGDQVSRIVSSARICPPRPSMCSLPEVALVLDSSGSITDKGTANWELMKNFTTDLLNGLRSKRDIRFTFIKFSEDATIEVPLTSDVRIIENAIRTAPFLGTYTNHAAALRQVEYSFLESRVNSTKYIIIITDGLPTLEQGQESIYARRLRADGVRIIAIGVTNQIDLNKLRDLAGNTGAVFQSQTFTSLSQEVNPVINAASVCRDDPPPNCDGPPEIVMILDASGSITDKGSNNWFLMKSFGRRVITSLSNKRNARFAYIRFSDTAVIDVPLTGDVNVVATVVESSPFIGGYTSHADALRKALDVLRTRRPGSTQYIIMVTDGEATWEQGLEYGIADQLKNQGVVIILIGVTNQIDLQMLRRLAFPQGYYFTSPTFGELPGQINSVVRATNMCVQPPTCDVAYVVLAIDVSSSIEEKGTGNTDKLKSFASQLAGGLISRYPNMKLALVTFSGTASVVSTFDQYVTLERFQQQINDIIFLGILTNLADAIRKSTGVIISGARSSSQIILITDGQPTAEELRTEEEARAARSLGIRIITLGVTSQVDQSLLQRISGDPQRSFYAPQFEQLGNQVAEVIQVSCNETPPPPPPPTCEIPLDIVFVVDASASLTEDTPQGWVDAKNALKTVVSDLTLRNSDVRFGLVVFSTFAQVDFLFQSDRNYVLQLVENIQYIGDRTNIADGIKYAREQVFIQARPGAKKVMVIITDGKSNERINEEVYEASISKAAPFDITIVVAGVTNTPDGNILRQMASVPERVIRAPNYATLSEEIDQISSAICGARQPPVPPPTAVPCYGTNVVFLVDDTSRLEFKQPGNFERLKHLIIQLATSISVEHPDAKFGMVAYGYPSVQIASFTYYRDLTSFETVVRRLRYRNVGSSLATGLTMVSNMLDGYQGFSQVIIIGDGESSVDNGQGIQEAWDLRSKLVRIFAIVVSNPYTTATLTPMLDQPSYLFYAPTYDPADITQRLPGLLQGCMGSPSGPQIPTYIPRDPPPAFPPPAFPPPAFPPPAFPPPAFPPPAFPPPAFPPPVFPTPAPTPQPDPNVFPIFGGNNNTNNVPDGGRVPAAGFPADIALLVDVSSSINQDTWKTQKDLLRGLVESFQANQPDVRFGAITYSSVARIGFDLTNDIDNAKNAINRLRFMNQRTNIAAALKLARDEMLTSPTTSKTIVIFTDGDPNVDEEEAFTVAQMIRAAPYNIKIVAIDITSKGDNAAMERITGHADRVLMEADSAKLIKTVQDVVKGTKSSSQNSPVPPPQSASRSQRHGTFGLIPIQPILPNAHPTPQPVPVTQSPTPRPRAEPIIDNPNGGPQTLVPINPPTNLPSTRPPQATTRPTSDRTTRPSPLV